MNAYAVLDRVGFRSFMRRLYRVDVIGAQYVPESGGCILASNHDSLVDPFILAVITTREIRYMAKSELFAHRVPAAALRSLGAFPVERGGGDQAAFSEAAELLRGGEVLGIFPQGTSKQHRERRWHRGAARLALVTGAPIVPVRMTGTRGLSLHRRVQITVGPPIHVQPARPSVAAAKTLTEQIERAVLAA
jgi:1-acyl-sn-glycerol-3-phosphate acyltransferase